MVSRGSLLFEWLRIKSLFIIFPIYTFIAVATPKNLHARKLLKSGLWTRNGKMDSLILVIWLCTCCFKLIIKYYSFLFWSFVWTWSIHYFIVLLIVQFQSNKRVTNHPNGNCKTFPPFIIKILLRHKIVQIPLYLLK